MSSRGYVKLFCCLSAALFLGTAAVNVIIDPQDVFRLGLFQRHANPNARFRRMAQYLENASAIDGLAFSSSRGGALDSQLLARKMGVSNVLNIAVPYGLITDHLPFLEFILRNKQSRGERISSVFLMLDADLFGTIPWTDRNIDAFLPPPIASAPRFWWRYLTAFQYRNWKKDLTLNFPSSRTSRSLVLGGFSPFHMRLTPATRIALEPPQNPAPSIEAPALQRQLLLLNSFVSLCQRHNIALTIATSPISDQNPTPLVRVRQTVDILAAVHPLMDFTAPNALSADPRSWTDSSHFTVDVGSALIETTFGSARPEGNSFGVRRGELGG